MTVTGTASVFEQGAERDARFDRRRALSATGELALLNRHGVLVAADVHVATRLGALTGEAEGRAVLALALAVRAVRLGSVCVDLAAPPALDALAAPDDVARGSAAEAPLGAGDRVGALDGFAWPDPGPWLDAVRGSRLVEGGVLRVEHGLVYLDRYRQQEDAVATALLERLGAAPPVTGAERLAAGLDRLFPAAGWAEQRAAAEASCRGLTTVVTGGPGTGKTTTLARVLALLADLATGRCASGSPRPRARLPRG